MVLPRSRMQQFARLPRSWRLLRAFPLEQQQPAVFYRLLANDTATLLSLLWEKHHPAGMSRFATAANAGAGSVSANFENRDPLAGLKILDVGGGPGWFAAAFSDRGASYYSVEPDHAELAATGSPTSPCIRARGEALPFADNSFDLVYSSNVVEHTPTPWAMADEMLRVVKPGGLMVLSYTVWLGPFGGHETGLIPHYIGGEFARRRYERRHGHPPKNVFGQSLFAVSAAAGLRYAKHARRNGTELVAAFPRYHPWWAWPVVHIPVVREFLTSNLVLVFAKPVAETSQADGVSRVK
ncbi:class I SAM-dependent methyltransferase [Corynebacterium choanae]|uniref:Putative methyltransferase n=1 Tax=Corynebacterium choanae TaxID=1862358 RepID=A0A3G6J3U1_9CORY|nr:class I SAM-dependent methyltransferase [Corynebacterium choanae]AZA12599.1 putative methyltransferase [Corynebacterium choanae]